MKILFERYHQNYGQMDLKCKKNGMGNNQEIRQRMETYRSILLVLNWIGAVVLIIVGFILVNNRYTQAIGIGVIIGSVVIGVIGHFLINVALAIPFILLNNGDILKNGFTGSPQGSISSSGIRSIVGNKSQKKCKRCHKEIDDYYSTCPHCGNNTFE
jgi:hypothetical protein